MSTQHDAIIIGTGQAGPPLADRMNREGLKVAVIERHYAHVMPPENDALGFLTTGTKTGTNRNQKPEQHVKDQT